MSLKEKKKILKISYIQHNKSKYLESDPELFESRAVPVSVSKIRRKVGSGS
jgi:hypothetical protein